jgi:hypothetical protein
VQCGRGDAGERAGKVRKLGVREDTEKPTDPAGVADFPLSIRIHGTHAMCQHINLIKNPFQD